LVRAKNCAVRGDIAVAYFVFIAVAGAATRCVSVLGLLERAQFCSPSGPSAACNYITPVSGVAAENLVPAGALVLVAFCWETAP